MLITTVPLELDILVLFLSKKKKKKKNRSNLQGLLLSFTPLIPKHFQNIFVDTLTQLLSDLLF